jgi:hypothetical protein
VWCTLLGTGREEPGGSAGREWESVRPLTLPYLTSLYLLLNLTYLQVSLESGRPAGFPAGTCRGSCHCHWQLPPPATSCGACRVRRKREREREGGHRVVTWQSPAFVASLALTLTYILLSPPTPIPHHLT